jgi:hypothetical protein
MPEDGVLPELPLIGAPIIAKGFLSAADIAILLGAGPQALMHRCRMRS